MKPPLKFPVMINVNLREGYSDYNLGQQLKAFLEARGVTVELVDKKQSGLFSKATGYHLVSFYNDMIWPQFKYARHSRPKSILSIQCIGPKVYPEHEYVCYLSTLVKPKMAGIPIKHVNVSPSTETEFYKIAKKYFSPSVVGHLREQASTIYYGMEEGFKIHEDANPDSLVVPYNRWEVGQKNLPLHMELSCLYKEHSRLKGVEVEQTFYINKDDLERNQKDIPALAEQAYAFQDQFYDRAEFRGNIGKHGMFLSTSVRESFGLYFLELLLAGSVGVFQRYPWIESLLPNYPFIGSQEELVPMMTWVRNNYEEARARIIQEVIPVIQQRFSQENYLNGLLHQIITMEAMDNKSE